MAEFIDTMHQFAGTGVDEKLVFLFKVYDLDGEFKFGIIYNDIMHIKQIFIW